MKITPLCLLLLGLSVCTRPVQRFLPIENGLALDTETGRDCRPNPHKGAPLPLCYDLYKANE